MAYTLHFTAEKMDISPWDFGNTPSPWQGTDTIYGFTYQEVLINNTCWQFDMVFADRAAAQRFLVDLVAHDLKGPGKDMLQHMKSKHPTARESMHAS